MNTDKSNILFFVRRELSPIYRRNYERFRKIAIGIYQRAGIINFDTLETNQLLTSKKKN